jgi:ADP-heptose:LPS heptosyltransferase
VSARPVLLVLRALGLGDFLTGVPALKALARAFPGHRRMLATPAVLEPLARLTGAIDGILPVGPLEALPPVPPPAVAVNLHGRGPESHRLLLARRPERLIAFENPVIDESRGSPAWRPREHEVHRWCRLLSESGIDADPADLEIETPEGAAPQVAVGATLLHPSAASVARCWPIERWSEVARGEIANGRRVIVTGSAGDVEAARAIAARAGLDDSHVFAGRTDLADLARLVAAAGRVVCADTGVAHLATALRTPSVVLFGPTSPAEWGPPAERPWHRVLWAGTTGPANAPRIDPGLLRIRPHHVRSALETLPEVARGAS